ncbi:hypothetical protein EV368DRAFT_39098, partial [Lentinula lateritia]
DLLSHLVDLYFEKRNTFMPLLHRATFDNGLRNGLHNFDRDFGVLVLSVCALGARYSDDLRAYAGERWKRAFWCLVFIDTFMSSFLGRAKATDPTCVICS